jgi:hypothetical protein
MTPRLPTVLLLGGGLATFAGTAISGEPVHSRVPSRAAVIAGADASLPAVRRVVAGLPGRPVTVRRVGGVLEAQAQTAALAGEGYDVVIGVGAQARAAVAQAVAAEVGDGTRFAGR